MKYLTTALLLIFLAVIGSYLLTLFIVWIFSLLLALAGIDISISLWLLSLIIWFGAFMLKLLLK